ncbi:sigma-54-dependent Fis family transcriptional regulator [Candidatus Poribacteria bacterium]|nr:sigma-54-dependent Fis family transcriptional regulator [Candidatus Poribacteria bacterium]MBT5532958.1 sigma-54-dependent Fis family transcriptional regulator [Candidatus Poribacteria bacterium]
MVAKILLVDDDPDFCAALVARLAQKGLDVDAAESGAVALARLRDHAYALVISDVRMPEMDGIELLRRVKEDRPQTPVLMLTAFRDVDGAVEAMKLGANDYLIKPVEGDILYAKITHILPEFGERPAGFESIVTCDPSMVKHLEMLDMVAQSNASVLLSGESGTGKEVFARAIHERSPRSSFPFVAVNCAGLPEGLLQSELFGHEKGSFTGASTQHKGKFEQADGGTLLLDEISEMPPELQAKLLRALQEREVDRLGGKRPIKVDVRVIATTNRDMQQHVRDGGFREDLFYRLCVVPITLPPLRERRMDILLLARHFLKEFCEQNQKSISDFTDAAAGWMESQQWHGNVRELRNVVERAVVLCQGNRVESYELNPELWVTPESDAAAADDPGRLDVRVGMTAHEVEKRLILKTLEESGGNKSRAAEILGITPRTIRNKLREYGLM